MFDESLQNVYEGLRGERLLLDNKSTYSDYEKKLINRFIHNRMEQRFGTYPYLIFGNFHKLVQICGEDMFNPNDVVDSEILRYAALENRRNGERLKIAEDSYDYSRYIASICYGYHDGGYVDMMLCKILDVIGLRLAFDNHTIYSTYSLVKTEFFITNTFLLRNYPEFYHEGDIEQLKGIGQYWTLNDTAMKRARKAMDRTIKEREKEEKRQKVKKIIKK